MQLERAVKKKRRFADFGTAVIVMALAGGAFICLGSDLLSSPVLTSNSPNVHAPVAPFSFDAPTWEVARLKAAEQERSRLVPKPGQASEETLLLENWRFTTHARISKATGK